MFNRDGFTKAATAMGYSPDEINQIATMKEAQGDSPASQLKNVQLQQAQLNLKQDQAINTPYTPGVAPSTNNRPPLGTMVFKTDTTQQSPIVPTTKTSTVEQKDFSSQVADIEARRRQDLIWYPENRVQINDIYNSELKALDPSGARAMKEKATSKLTSSGVTLKAVEQMENYFKEANKGEKGGVSGLMGGMVKTVKGKLQIDENAQQYNAKRDALIATLKGLTGDVGVMTEQDARRIVQLLPKLGMSNNVARNQFQELRELIAEKFSTKPGQTIIEGFNKDIVNNNTPLKVGGNPIDFGGTNKGNEAFTNLEKARQLAKQALTEKDPEKKRQLLADSRALSKVGSEQNQKLTINPITYGLGKTQDYLSKSETLPAIGGIVGAFAGPGGSAIGAGEGQYLKTLLKKGNSSGKSGLGNMIPNLIAKKEPLTLPELGSIGAKAGTAYLTSKVFLGATNYLKNAVKFGTFNPTKISGALRDIAAETTPTVNTSKILEAGKRWAKLDPASAEIWNEMKTGITKNMPTKDLLDLLTSWGNRTWTISGNIKDKAAAQIMKQIYGAGRETILEQAPEVAKYTANLKAIKDVPFLMKAAQKGSWLLLKLLGIGKLGGL